MRLEDVVKLSEVPVQVSTNRPQTTDGEVEKLAEYLEAYAAKFTLPDVQAHGERDGKRSNA